MFQLALVLNQLGRFEQALPLLSKVNQSGSDVMSMFEYANALAGIGKKEDAMKIYASITALKTDGMQGVQGQIVTAIKERAAEAAAKIGAPAAK
jgi:predicted negative regulator of RcsB-dependent stress response